MIGQNVIVKFETSWNPFETFSTVEVVFFFTNSPRKKASHGTSAKPFGCKDADSWTCLGGLPLHFNTLQ